MTTGRWVRRLLWIDGLAGLSAGVLALVLGAWLSDLYALPRTLVTFVGLVNLAYSAYSLSLATRGRRRVGAVIALAVANAAWAGVCAVLAARFWNDASALGVGVIVFEGVFVAVLAVFEWRYRHALVITGAGSS